MKNKFFIKTLSVVIIIFLLITTSVNDFAYAISITSSMQANVTNTASLKDFNINNNIVSYNSGKITSAINCNSDTVVINIQDFHCNPSVQKNISDILSTLVEKYNIKSVYVEGGYGNINTKWLSDIKDENIKTQLIKVLLENGSLTGTEYFSAINPSSNISIYGIEKESVYKENFERLQNIFSNRSRYERIIKAFEKDLNFLQNKYFSSENKKFNKVLNKYKNGQIETRKYYKILFKYIQKYKNPTNNDIYGTILPIKIEDYPNIYTYMTLSEYEKKIKFTKITVELKKLLTTLKNNISYEQYNSIIKGTNNLKDITELVSVLSKLPEDFKNTNFSPEIKNFINYVEISKQINPVKLVEEERILIENIRLALSNNEAEFDISYLSDFFSYFKDYLNTSITSENYKYFSSKFKRFQQLWDKYTYYNQINNYKKDFDILETYYKTNIQRDYLFLENIKQHNTLLSGINGKKDSNYANILEKAKNIIIVITGGFHTEGLEKVITKNNISYMVITPNIKGGTDFANNRYELLLKMPIQTLSEQAFQLPLLSNGERLQIVYEGLKQLDIEPTQENIEILNTTANEIVSSLTGRQTKYKNIFEQNKGTINVNEHKFFDMQNLVKLTVKEITNFVNPKNYADETFSFMEKFLSKSNGRIWEINRLPTDIIEQLRNIGYSEYLPEFLQFAYYNIGKQIIKKNKNNNDVNINEYEFSANNCPFMIKFPNGKVVVILREMDGATENYYIIDENFNWDNPPIEFVRKKRIDNPKIELIKYLEKQDYAKDNDIRLLEKEDANSIFITANSGVKFINLKNNNLHETYYSEKQKDKDLTVILNELNNNENDKYSQTTNLINVLEIENFSKLNDNQIVFISLQDYSNAEIDKKKHIEEYIEYAIKNNEPIIIYPNLYVSNDNLSNANLNYLFGTLAEKFVSFSNDYIVKLSQSINELPNVKKVNDSKKTEVLAYSVKEILKNAFVYGTLSNVNKPIVVNFDNTNSQIDILTLNEGKEENIYRKVLTFSNKLRGYGLGIENIKEGVSKFNWQYLDNFKDDKREISRASLKLNNKDGYLQINKSKLKNNDYYNEVSNKILEIFKQNNIDINIDKNLRTFNFIVSLLLNNKSITDKDLEKLNGTKAEIIELILEALNKKLISLDQTDRYYRTVLRRIEDITFVLEIKETKEIGGKEIEQINFVSLQVLSLYGQPELFVTTKNEDRYGEGENDPVIELEFYLQDNKNYEIKNIHILDERNIIEKTFDNLLDFNKNEELKKNIDKKTIETIGYTDSDLEIISLNDFVKYKTSNNPKQLTQNAIKNLEDGKIIALFPPLNNLDLQKTDSFEELKYMYDVVRTILWDFSEDFKKINNAVKSGNIDVVLNEILKNAFVHGNNLKTAQPIYLYLKGDRLCISNIVDDKNIASQKQKFAATMAGLCGVHSGIKNLQIYQGLDYKDETNNSIFTASFTTTLKQKQTEKEYKLSYDKCPFIIEFPDGNQPPVIITAEKIQIGFGSIENFYIIDKNSDLNTRRKIDEINKYGHNISFENDVIRGNINVIELSKDTEQLTEFYKDKKIINNNLKNNKLVKDFTNEKKDFVNAAEVHLYFLKSLGVDIDNMSSKETENIEKRLNKLKLDSYPDIVNMDEEKIKQLNNELKSLGLTVTDKEIKKQIENLRQVNIFVHLKDYVKEALSKDGIFDNINIYDKYKRIEKYINYNLQNENNPIIICPNLSADFDDTKKTNYGNLKYFFDKFGDNLIGITKFYVSAVLPEIIKTIDLSALDAEGKKKFNDNLENILSYSLKEMLKNAFIHGNFSDFNEPIILNFDKENSQINVLNENKAGEEDVYKKLLTFASALRGYGKGIEDINEKLNRFRKNHNNIIKTGTENTGWSYFDNFKDEKRTVSRASLKLNDAKNDNIIYKGKSKGSFIVKTEQDMFYVIPFTAPFQRKAYVITTKNNKIMQEGVEYFFPWAYGLDIKDEKEHTIITKEQEFNENIKIIPVTEFSPMKFANVTLEELSRKYFTKVTNIKENVGGNIFLEDLIRSNPDQIMDMWDKIDKNIKEGRPITIYPLRNYSHEEVISKISEQDYDMFIQLYKNLNLIITNFCSNYRDRFLDNEKFKDLDDKTKKALEKELRYGLVEMIKNALVHGNHLDLSKPITLEFDKENFQIKVSNDFSKEVTEPILQNLAAVAGLAGFGLGIEKMSDEDNLFKYSDNFNEERTKSTASLKLKQKNISNKIKNEIKAKIDIEDDTIEFLMENVISIPDNELLEILKGSKSGILKMLLEELDKTIINLSAKSNIKSKIEKMQFVIETTDENCISFGNNGVVAQNSDYYYLAKPIEEDTIKKLIKNTKNIHIVFRDKNYKEQFEADIKNGNDDKFKKRLHENYPSVETIKEMGFDDASFTALRLDEFIKDKEQFEQNLFENLQNDKLVALFPFANIETSAQRNILSNVYIKEEFFREISRFLVKKTIGKKYNEQAYIEYFANDILEIFKNVFVHGNNISLDKPIYLYIKDDRLYISNVVDKENIASNYQKTLAVLSGLTGAHLGNKQIKSNTELEHKHSDIEKLKTGDVYKNSVKIGNVSNVVYKGPADTSFVIDIPGKGSAFARYHLDSFNITNYILEAENGKVDKDIKDFIFKQYGLNLKTSLDGKTITILKNNDYIKGTKIVPIPKENPKLQINGKISQSQIKKQNEKNKQFFKDLQVDISNENEYEVIHLAEDSSNIEYQIRTAVRKNKPLIVYPYLYEDFNEAIKNKNYERLYFLIEDLGNNLVSFTNSYGDILTNGFIDTFNLNLKKSVREVLKNAIVHGNVMDLTLPVVIKFDKQNFKIDMFNRNIQKKQKDNILKNITAAAGWMGYGEGINEMKSYKTLEYSDNNNNNDTRKPTDKIWQTTIQKKINYKKEIRNKMHKIDIEDDTIELLLENIISIPDDELLKILDKNKSEILKMLFEEFEKTKTVDTFDPYDENTLIAEMFYIVAEKNDDTCMVLKLINNKLAIIAANADDMSENYIYIDDNMKNNLIKNIKNIHVVFTNEEETKSYAEEFEHKLKQYNSDVINRLLQKNYPSIETINKMGFTEEDLINLRLDEFIKDKDTFQKNLFDNLQNGKLVALFPFASPETSAEDSIFLNRYVNDEFFKEISYYLAQQIRENSDTYFSVDYLKAILEILKNSFVHGNNISMNKPIFFYIKNGRLYITNVVDKENTASNYKKNLAVLANLTGVHYGNEYVKSHFYLEYKSSDFKELKTGDIYEASIKVGNINSIENQKMAGIKDNNLSKVYELLLKGIPPSLVNIYVVLKETLEIFLTPNNFINAHEQGRQHGAESLVKQANILKAVTTALSLSVISLSVITGTLPFLLAIQIIIGAVISMFGISAATHYYINYEFINDVKDVINKNRENIKDGILTVKVVNKNIDEDININNIKLVNSGLKINGEIVWINKTNKELVIYCKEQNYEEILPVAKNIALKTTKANKVTEFCVDTRETAPEITGKDGITIINSSVYNELKENKISDTEIASAIKEANIMEQKTNTLYSVSKNNQIFLEYEIKDDISYNNFINKVLSENLGFGYVIDIETVNKYGKDFETKIEQAKKEKNINIYIKGKDKQINFKRIENFNDIKTLEEQIEKVNFSENIPLIPASKLFSLVDKERFTDKFVMLNKLANLFFIKREYTTEYVKNLANTADEKLLKEISNYGAETVLNNLHENNIENISNLLLQNPTIKIIFNKIEKNNPQKAKELKDDFIKTLTIRTLLYNLAGEQHLRNEFKEKLNYIEELFIDILKDKKQFERLKIKDNILTFDNNGIEFIEEIQKEYGTEHSKIFEETKYDAITKLEYILTYLIDERHELNNDDNDFNSTLKMKALLSAA